MRLELQNNDPAFWFGEDQARYVLCVSPDKLDAFKAQIGNLPLILLGVVEGDALVLHGQPAIALSSLRAAHQAVLPKMMEG
jgi:phosphoribosylformylglycinamidine synthase